LVAPAGLFRGELRFSSSSFRQSEIVLEQLLALGASRRGGVGAFWRQIGEAELKIHRHIFARASL
jgi:hypothetical protein